MTSISVQDEVNPYQMCSRQECEERERCKEVSVWERNRNGNNDEFTQTSNQAYDPPHLRRKQQPNKHQRQQSKLMIKIDPRRAIQKYRRSAAGSELDGAAPHRSLIDLRITVEYILRLLAENKISMNSTTDEQETFRSLVDFVENRIRAVQTDCVKWQGYPQTYQTQTNVLLDIQVKVTRAHILMLYLMSDDPDYQVKFGKRALSTALSQYFEVYRESSAHEAGDTLDEMLSYSMLFQLQQDLNDRKSQDDFVVSHTVLDTYHSILLHQQRKGKKHSTTSQLKDLPLFQWSLCIVQHACNGQWYSLLQKVTLGKNILAKCLLAPLLHIIRYKALQAYNVSWRKGEGLADTELARLLCLPSPEAATRLAKLYGLPVEEQSSTTTTPGQSFVIHLQSVPIQLINDSSTKTKIRDNDDVVFGDCVDSVGRVDVEGLWIPSSLVMGSILFNSRFSC